MMIDTHCHILKEDYENQEEVINKMKDNIMIVSGASPKDIEEIVELCSQYKNIYGTIGIHPEFADTYTKEDLKKLEENLKLPKIVGVGEIGLDYHYTIDNKEKQKRLFIKQIELAKKYNKPVVIHSRDSKEDTYNIIKQYENIKFDMHCYSYDLEMAKLLTEQNIKLGIGGILTFKKEKTLKKIAKEIDLKYLLLETDSPYLTPEPNRGKKNEPYNIKYIAEKIAELKTITPKQVFEQTTKNALDFYDIKIV